jgi:hypothetical protein
MEQPISASLRAIVHFSELLTISVLTLVTQAMLQTNSRDKSLSVEVHRLYVTAHVEPIVSTTIVGNTLVPQFVHLLVYQQRLTSDSLTQNLSLLVELIQTLRNVSIPVHMHSLLMEPRTSVKTPVNSVRIKLEQTTDLRSQSSVELTISVLIPAHQQEPIPSKIRSGTVNVYHNAQLHQQILINTLLILLSILQHLTVKSSMNQMSVRLLVLASFTRIMVNSIVETIVEPPLH